jgi:hypothetical protein
MARAKQGPAVSLALCAGAAVCGAQAPDDRRAREDEQTAGLAPAVVFAFAIDQRGDAADDGRR